MKLTFVAIVACLGIALASSPAHGSTEHTANLVSNWNETVLALAEKEDGFLTLKGLRTATMMHIAMHDAVAAIDDRYAPYIYDASAEGMDPIVAATQAAFTVASDQYPGHRDQLAALRDQWLSVATDGPAKEAGIVIGNASAAAILDDRKGDGWDTTVEYTWHPMGPGVYAEFSEHSGTPQGFVFGAGWAKARGFALASANQFRSPAPPDIDSNAYTQAFNEVKLVGRFQSMRRTPDQTHLALWWKDFAESSHNRLARDLAAKEGLSLGESARLFALVNMSIFDAYVSVFENKFFYNHWRPYTAIRWAANDGNPNTAPEETWTNTHQHTYAFPSYPSAHGTACAAAQSVFAAVFGDDYSFTMYTERVDIGGPMSGKIEMQPVARSFDSFSDAAMECAMSRVYLGIHFRYDSIAGFELGQQVGNHVLANRLRRMPQ